MEKDFDDIDDTILTEPTQAKTDSKKAKSSAPGSQSAKSSNGLSKSIGALSKIDFSDGFKAVILIVSTISIILLVYFLMVAKMYGTSLIIGIGGLIIFFLYLFTGAVDRVKLNGMVIFCYLFSSAALIGAILPFFYFDKVVLNQELMMSSPLGVLKGCVKVIGDEQVPPEMDCKRQKSQWVVNIGGTIEEKNLKECVTVECMNREKRTHPERYSNNNIQITGGLVVPLYILVLSIVGAAVNMTRRVPEYQRRVYVYLDEREQADKPPSGEGISSEDAREFMVFQLMQVVSAPMIAITAYYIIVPQTPAVSIVLGVLAGFASETVLIALRAFADKLMPSGVVTRAKTISSRTPKLEEPR